MTYSVIQPPFSKRLDELSKSELRDYRNWFHSVMPQRIKELEVAVKDSQGFEAWDPNLTPESLSPLGEWFRVEVDTRPRSPEELALIEERTQLGVHVPPWDLTIRTLSLAMDVGMYFGSTVIRNVEGTKWDQDLRSPNEADYGQPVVAGGGRVALNPVRIARTLAYGFARGVEDGGQLRKLFDVWLGMLKP